MKKVNHLVPVELKSKIKLLKAATFKLQASLPSNIASSCAVCNFENKAATIVVPSSAVKQNIHFYRQRIKASLGCEELKIIIDNFKIDFAADPALNQFKPPSSAVTKSIAKSAEHCDNENLKKALQNLAKL